MVWGGGIPQLPVLPLMYCNHTHLLYLSTAQRDESFKGYVRKIGEFFRLL